MKAEKSLLALFLFILLSPVVISASAPDVTLVSPEDGNISVSGNITFACNVTDDKNVYNVSLFHDINGTFSLYNTKGIMTLEPDSSTMVLCHFDGTYACEVEGVANNIGTDFVSSRFFKGLRVNDSDKFSYPTSGNIDYYKGTLEFWIQPRYNTWDLGDYVYLFATDEYGGEKNKMDLYIYYEDLYFEFHDDYDDVAWANVNVNWGEGEWHHVAVTWDFYADERQVDIFLNGNNASTAVSGGMSSPGDGQFGDNMYLGNRNGIYVEHSVFDEFRISDRVLTPDEINASYVKGFSDHENESINWTINNVDDGSYLWNCLAYDNESQGSWASPNYTIHVDAYSYPVTNFIDFSLTEDEIDPEMIINATANVTDISNVSSVVFQWRKTIDWDTPPVYNDSMDYNGGTGLFENASIAIDKTGGVYYYRTWSNDTFEHSGYSETYNLTAVWDYTWNRNPSDLGTAYGFVSCPDCYVGTLVINNTGDDTLSFALSDNWPLNIYYNVSNPFSLGPKNVTHINITAQFSGEDSEYGITINLTASHGSQTPSPIYQNVTVKLNSYSGGPYFDSDDIYVNYTTNPFQSMNYTLSARIKNIGNETATGVWINWSLPDGWENVSGILNRYVGNLNGTEDGGNIAWNNITVFLDPYNASAGVRYISVFVASDENLSVNSTHVVYVSCNSDDGKCGSGCSYVTDVDCSIPSGSVNAIAPGSSPIQSADIKDYDLELSFPSRFDINRGETRNLSLTVSHSVYNAVLNDVYLYLSGYPQTFISIPVGYLDGIGYNQSGTFIVEISAPIYALYREYSLNLTVKGVFHDGGKRVDANRTDEITLVTHKYIEEATLDLFDRAKEAILSMNVSGYNVHKMTDLFKEMEYALDSGNYDRVRELSESIESTRDLAVTLESGIGDLDEKLREVSEEDYEMPDTEKMLYLAKSAFHRGEYEIAEERLDAAMVMYWMEILNFRVWAFFQAYWLHILSVIIVASIAGFFSRKRIMVKALNRRLTSLVEDEREVRNLIISLEREHFIHGKYGFNEYLNRMSGYENMIVGIAERRVKYIRQLVSKIGRSDAIRRLGREEEIVKKRIGDVQKEYFELGKIGKKYYDRIIVGLRSELIDIRKMIDILESGGSV